jgi:membrane-bound lytic murein transglycosylase D
VTLDPPVLTDTVTINSSVDLRLVSDIVGAPIDELMALNPSLLRMVTPPDAPFDLHLPAGTATLFPAAHRRSSLKASATHGAIIAWLADDTLASVARTYRVSVAELATANQLAREQRALQGVEGLVVPLAPAARARPSHMLLYTARRGRYPGHHRRPLRRLAQSVAPLEQIEGVKVEPGRRLHVAEPASVRRTRSRAPSERIFQSAKARKAAAKPHEKASANHLHASPAPPPAAKKSRSSSAKNTLARDKSATRRRKSSSSEETKVDQGPHYVLVFCYHLRAS